MSQDVSASWRVSGSVNWYRKRIDGFKTQLFFPTTRPFAIAESDDATWDAKLNTQVTLPGSVKLQLSYIYYADRNVPQGTEYARSSLDFGLKRAIWGDGEVALTVTDLLNNFGRRQQLVSTGVTTLYENLYETQRVTLGVRYRF